MWSWRGRLPSWRSPREQDWSKMVSRVTNNPGSAWVSLVLVCCWRWLCCCVLQARWQALAHAPGRLGSPLSWGGTGGVPYRVSSCQTANHSKRTEVEAGVGHLPFTRGALWCVLHTAILRPVWERAERIPPFLWEVGFQSGRSRC